MRERLRAADASRAWEIMVPGERERENKQEGERERERERERGRERGMQME
jgi:hypothetical protein